MNSLSTTSYVLDPARRSVARACLRDRLPAEDGSHLEPIPRETGKLLYSSFEPLSPSWSRVVCATALSSGTEMALPCS